MGVVGSKTAETRSEAIEALRQSVATRADPWRALHDRKDSLKYLLDYLEKPPMATLVILGPQSSGKSAVLRELERLFCTKEVLVVTAPVIYIDCRRSNFGVPADAARAMRVALFGYLDKLSSVLSFMTFSFPGVTVSAAEAIRAVREELSQSSNVLQMVNVLDAYMKRNPKARPTLILDEARRLSQWPPQDRKNFMDIFTAMTKQDHQAHVLLCSSDSFFVDWLESSLSIGTWRATGIGYFDENVARAFFGTKLVVAQEVVPDIADPDWDDIAEQSRSRPPGIPSIRDDQWKAVFDVCGGCPLELQVVAFSIQTAGGIDMGKNLEDGLKELQDQALALVARGVRPAEDDAGWSGDEYNAVMELVKGKGYADAAEVAEVLTARSEKEKGRVIRAMVAANLLHLRFVCVEYSDIVGLPEKHHRYQITAVSPSHLDAIRRVTRDPGILWQALL